MKEFSIKMSLVIFPICYFFSGCASPPAVEKNSAVQEPPAVEDSPEPAGYAPMFMKRTASMPSERPNSAQTVFTRSETQNGKTVRVYAHILDTDGTYYSGGAGKSAKKKGLFCGISDTVNGQKKEIKKYTVREVTEKDKEPVALAVVMDNSGSMGDERARELQTAVSEFVENKRPEDLTAVIRYDDHIEIEAPLSSDKDEIRSKIKINGLQGFGRFTAIHSSVYSAIDHLNEKAPPKTAKHVIIFTDGTENSSTVSKEQMIAHAIESNTVVHTIDFGNGVQQGYLSEIAEKTGGAYLSIFDRKKFRAMYEDMYFKLKNSYVIEYSPEEQGIHDLELKQCWGKGSTVSSFKYNNTPLSYLKQRKMEDLSAYAIYFKPGREFILKDSMPEMDKLIEVLNKMQFSKLEVQGHTAAGGTEKENLRLSEARAKSVHKYLVSRGIPAEKLEIKGYGAAVPASPNTNEEEKKKNRRVTFLPK